MVRRGVLFALLVSGVVVGAALPASAHRVVLRATLTGAAERPGPGDPDGVGSAAIVIDHHTGQLCLSLSFNGVTLPTTGLHIHRAPTNEPGPVVVPFTNPTRGFTYQCRTVAGGLLAEIAGSPGNYYINLHTLPDFSAGAIRGQLRFIATVPSPSTG